MGSLGLHAYNASLAAMGIPPGFEYVAVEKQFQGPLMQKLLEFGATAQTIGFVELSDGISPEQLASPERFFSRDVKFLADIPAAEPFPVYESGLYFLDPCLKWRLPELVVMAGPYSQGKSLLAQVLALRFISRHGEALDCGALLCSFEDLTDEIRAGAERHAEAHNLDPAKLLRRVSAVVRPADQERLLGWFIELVTFHNRTYGTRLFVLDPWNELDHERDARQLETEYVRTAMREFRKLTDTLKIIVIVVTHVPAKMINADNTIQQFRIANSFGSVQFGNKADRGICVARTRKYGGDHMIFYMDKVKIEPRMGRRDVCALKYDRDRHTLTYDVQATAGLREDWRL